MKKFDGIHEVAWDIFHNLMWNGMEAFVSVTDTEDVYNVGYRRAGSFGDMEHERHIICIVDLSPDQWYESLADWDINSSLIGTTDLDDDLICDYISDTLVDHIQYRIDMCKEEGR